jgi:hypothetical protein
MDQARTEERPNASAGSFTERNPKTREDIDLWRRESFIVHGTCEHCAVPKKRGGKAHNKYEN